MLQKLGSDRGRIVVLDAVRGLAALGVALAHYFMSRGWAEQKWETVSVLCVEVFFILSGLVLAPQIAFCITSKNVTENLRTFFMRRWIRTIPPYVIALVVMSMIARQLFSGEFFKYLFFFRNFAGFSESGDFYAPAWSLAVEEWFYVAFPAFLWATRRSGLSIVKQSILFIGALLLAKILYFLVTSGQVAFARRIVVFRLDAIAFGFLSYLFLRRIEAGLLAGWNLRWLAFLVASVTCLIATLRFCSLAPGSSGGGVAEMAFLYVAPLAAAALILNVYALEKWAVGNAILGRVSEVLGQLSYPVYLFHMIFVALVGRALAGASEGWRISFYLFSLFTVAYLFHIYVEKPLLAARPKYRKISRASEIKVAAVSEELSVVHEQ